MTKELGNWGENVACEYLVDKGFNILARNWRIKFGKKTFGEIDIIARKKWRLLGDRTIHFVEVKTIIGDSRSFLPEDKVDYRKQEKLKKLCQLWLDENKFSQYHAHQIDVMGVLVDTETNQATISHFENVVEG